MSHRWRLAPLFLITLLALVAPAAAQAEPPYCLGGTFYVTPGEPSQLLAPEFEPCFDPEGEEYTLELVTLPEHGTITADDNGTVYTADAGFRGVDTFTYRAVDADGEQSEPAQVSLHVGRPPTCSDAQLTVSAGQRLAIRFPCPAIPGGELFASVLTPPFHGTLVGGADPMSATYFPKPGYSGPDEVLFYANDELGFTSEVHKVAITVTSPPAPKPRPPDPDPPVPPEDPLLSELAAQGRLGPVRRRGLRVAFTAARVGTADVRLALTRRAARRLGLRTGRAGDVTVGRRRLSVAPGANAVRVPLTRRARRAMARARRVVLTLTVTLRDDAGNRVSQRLVVTLTR